MKLSGRKSKNVIVKKSEHIVSAGPHHDKWVMEDRGSFGKRRFTEARLKERVKSSPYLRKKTPFTQITMDGVDKKTQAYYNKPANRLTNIMQLDSKHKKQTFRRRAK